MTGQPELFGADPTGGEASVPAPALQATVGVTPDVSRAPLATRMRPRTLEEFVGQLHAVGAGSVLRRALDAGQSPSLILWGPPGSGKTTLAQLIAAGAKAVFEPVSATSAGVADLRKVVDRAATRRRVGQDTLLFIDEIHRFNRTQQDAVLPHVESGLLRLLGATTENPSFTVNAALLSRARVVHLDALVEADLSSLVDRALGDAERGLGGRPVVLSDPARRRLLSLSGGDARVALNALELAASVAAAEDGEIGVTHVEGALMSPALLYDRAGDQHYWVVSALIKSVRGSDPDAAVYWLARMLEAGEDPMFVARRLVILAAEDIGLADPQALPLAVAAQTATHSIGMPEARLVLSEAAIYLALAPKSNAAYRAYGAAAEDVGETMHQPVPLHLRNASGSVGREMGFGAGYRYAHDESGGVAEQQHLPDALAGRTYYTPSDRGAERGTAERLAALRGRLRGEETDEDG
ncbi:MAG: replication-associated recombination protein A [Candidatus Dormibacteria bacterium]